MAAPKKSMPGRGDQRKQQAKLKPQDCTLGLEVMNPKAAGIDIGNEEHWVAVPPSMDGNPVRSFKCFTADLKAMANWLTECGIQTVAMQSTGVYWMPAYDILEEAGIKVFLVNARDTRNLPGRKTDIQECQWLLKLHVYGLLRNSVLPEAGIRVMRTYWRQRQQHVADAARSVQRMQKALTQMNLQLANVISDISGLSGERIIQAILAGERNPWRLAELRDPRVKASKETIAGSLEGNWRPELLFVLKQEHETHAGFQRKIQECDEALGAHYQTLEAKADPKALAPVRHDKRPHGNVPENLDLRGELYRTTGVDLTSIDGINVLTAQTLTAEVGSDMSRFETEAHFVSFLGLCPNNKISGGKVIGREKRKTVSRAGRALKMGAATLLRSKSYLGAQYRRLRTKLGAPKAMKAMANKMARIAYRMMKYGEDYVDRGNDFYEEKYRNQQVRMLTKKAVELGLQVVGTT
jgi:transposase